jgi:hypothetical protein
VHGEGLFIAFLLGYFSLSLILLLNSSVLPSIAMVLLALSTAGAWPGAAYFNIAPWPDFTGEDREAVEKVHAQDLEKAAAFIEKQGIDRLLGELALWHLVGEVRLVTLPKALPGEDYSRTIETAARPYGIRHALLPPDKGAGQPLWKGRDHKLIKINP